MGPVQREFIVAFCEDGEESLGLGSKRDLSTCMQEALFTCKSDLKKISLQGMTVYLPCLFCVCFSLQL